MSRQQTCPVDRQAVTQKQLKAAPRILRNLLSRLSIQCDFSPGCQTVLKLDQLYDHSKECDFNPRKPVMCTECEVTIPKDQLKDHNCIRDLRQVVMKQAEQLTEMDMFCKNLKKEMSILKEAVKTLRGTGSSVSAAGDAFDCDDLERWAQSLPRAKVTRWGGMISTPDSSLQESVRKALIDSLCPQHIVNELMENSHERRWPPGLSTLEIRQMNRRIYENYICRKIPGKQAVVVMACDNIHVTEEMILDPGLVMIFAHGIE